MDHSHDHLSQHLHQYAQRHHHHQYVLNDHEDLEEFVNLDGHDPHFHSVVDEAVGLDEGIGRPEDAANAPIELLLNAIRNSPSPLSPESDHYSRIDHSESIHNSAIHSPHHQDGQDVTQHYPPHGTDVSMLRDSGIDPRDGMGELMPQPVQEQDHTSYHAVPEQSDMHELGKYTASQEETGEYVIEAAYPDPALQHQTELDHDSEHDYRPVPLRRDGEHADEYLNTDALDPPESTESMNAPEYSEQYAEDLRQDRQDADQTYVDGGAGSEKEYSKRTQDRIVREVAPGGVEAESGVADRITHGQSRQQEQDQPRIPGALRDSLGPNRGHGSVTRKAETDGSSTSEARYRERQKSSEHPTELERALRRYAIPEQRPEEDQAKADAYTPIRPSVGRNINAQRHEVAVSSQARPSVQPPLPQVVPQKRKARQSPETIPAASTSGNSANPARASSSTLPITSTPSHAQRRATTPPFLEEMRRTKISRMFAATTGPGGSRIPEQQMSFSTITLLHGHIVQKSYLKEKRFLCPPPVVRMAGSVSDTVETISLQILNQDVGPDIPIISNNQGVKFNVPGREEGARAYLREGLYFSGLYASRTGKAKSLKLRLNVFQPGGTEPRPPHGMDDYSPTSEQEPIRENNERVETIQQSGNHDNEAQRRQRNMNSLLLNGGGREGSMDPEERQAAIDAMIENDPMFNMPADPRYSGAQAFQHGQNDQDADGMPDDGMSLLDIAAMAEEHSTTARSGKITEWQNGRASKRTKHLDRPSKQDSPAESPGTVEEGDPAGQSSRVIEEMEGIGEQSQSRPWATFDGLPMQIVSKPTQSKRPNFAFKRTNASYLYVGDPISLWSRINSQSVRTKYLFVEHGKLVGMPSDWSAFVIDVVKRGEPPGGLPEKNRPDPGIITFNSTVILRDIHSDYRTEPLLLIKVMSGKPILNEFGPVSELNKVAFAKVVAGQGKWYLRAPGHDRDKLEDENGKPLPRVRKRIRGKKDTVNSVVKKRVAPALDTEDSYGDPSAVRLEPSKISVEVVDGQSVEGEYFDDFITWTISGVTEHTYTFFEGRHEVGDYSTVFRRPLTPMPILLDIPEYRAMENTITMTVTNFYYDDDNPAYRGKPLLLYLGAIGPLKFRSYRSTAPAVPSNAPNDVGAAYLNSFPAVPIDGGEEVPPEARPYSSVPSTVPHTIIVIHLPAPKEMWDATRIERERQIQLEQLQLAHDAKYRQEDVVDDTFAEPAWPPLEEDERKPRHRQSQTDGGDAETEDMAINLRYEQRKVQPLGEDFMQEDESAGDGHLEGDHHNSAEHLSGMEMTHGNHRLHQNADDPMSDLRVEDFPPFGPEEMGLEDSTSAVMDAMMHSHDGPDQVDSLLEHQLHEYDHAVSDDMHQLFTAAALQAAAQNGQDLLDAGGMLNGDSSVEIGEHLGHQHATAHAHGHDLEQDGMEDDGNAQYEFYTHEEHEPQVGMMHEERSDITEAPHADRYSVRRDSLSTMTEADSVLQSVDARMESEIPAGASPTAEISPMVRKKSGGKASASGATIALASTRNKPAKTDQETRTTHLRPKQARKPRTPQIKPTLTSTALHGLTPPPVRMTRKPYTACPLYAQGHVNRTSQLGGSSLPLLFLRQSDGTGYHTGKNVVIEKLYAGSDSETWNISIV